MLSLEEKIDKIWNVVMKSGESPKVLTMSDSTMDFSPKKRKEILSVDVMVVEGKLMVEDVVVKGVAKGFVLSCEVKNCGLRVRTRNRLKNQTGGLGY